MRTWLLFWHIVGAGTWLGGNVTQAMATPGFVKAGGEAAGRWWRTTLTMGRFLYPPAAVVVLLTGVLLITTSSGGYQFSDPFVSVGFAMVIVGAVLGSVVFGPRGRRAAEQRESGDDAGALVTEQGLARFGMLDTVLLLVTIWAMVARWGV